MREKTFISFKLIITVVVVELFDLLLTVVKDRERNLLSRPGEYQSNVNVNQNVNENQEKLKLFTQILSS